MLFPRTEDGCAEDVPSPANAVAICLEEGVAGEMSDEFRRRNEVCRSVEEGGPLKGF